jgi:predicted SAM-dependent methyltransferase
MRCLDFGKRLPYARLFEERGCCLLAVDLVNDSADAKMDITGLALRNEAFDLVICYHVLEHVREDAVALKELHRVLKSTGTLIIQVPWFPHRDSTLEYEGSPFGPDDHVREYGQDLIEKIKAAGFQVALRNETDGLGAEEIERYGIAAAVSFICTKEE